MVTVFLEGEYLVPKIKGKKRERIGSTRRRKKMVCQGETVLGRQRRKKLGEVKLYWQRRKWRRMIFCSGLLLVGGGSPPEIWMPEAPPMQVHLTNRLTMSTILQGVFFNWPPFEFAKCWPASNQFRKNVRVPDCPPP